MNTQNDKKLQILFGLAAPFNSRIKKSHHHQDDITFFGGFAESNG